MSALVEPQLFSADQFEYLIELGVFAPEDRLELIDGEIIRMSPIGPRHGNTVSILTLLFVEAIGRKRMFPWSQTTTRVDSASSPQPDFALLKPLAKGYPDGPKLPDILLFVEVADSSLNYDRTTKVSLYASVGVKEFWIVNLVHNVIEVYRDPIPGEMRYATKVVAGAADSVSPLAFPDVSLPVSSIIIN